MATDGGRMMPASNCLSSLSVNSTRNVRRTSENRLLPLRIVGNLAMSDLACVCHAQKLDSSAGFFVHLSA